MTLQSKPNLTRKTDDGPTALREDIPFHNSTIGLVLADFLDFLSWYLRVPVQYAFLAGSQKTGLEQPRMEYGVGNTTGC